MKDKNLVKLTAAYNTTAKIGKILSVLAIGTIIATTVLAGAIDYLINKNYKK